ncbi:TonB-dependent receptor [Rhabdobacter roseus]|uniref:Iron complex outermembrane receptor protein n=1 Tax=Rhabdobacter roseus TaxID=1655419 RepID=A0A840U5S5_9BACT|nr:TonB-dependent receptor [Rhabdobacter roseus]MBB5287179.1 iron complex outermembrane receptor protein [Rhabdobacter roseus]
MKQFFKSSFLLGVLLFPLWLSAQENTIINATVSGKVVDSRTNEALIGATVAIKGTTNGAATDVNGEFGLITGQKLPFTLIVSYVGYQKKEVLISETKVEIKLDANANQLDDVIISSRRRQESAQDVPIPISVVSGVRAEDAGAFNVNRLKELVPTVQLYSSNPRNTTLNIRGLGSTFGLTNDGIDPGVGFYVDGVYFARPAATTLDFIDIEQIEVLRGPQGTLFGKNTTAGAFNITTRAPSFTPGANFEVSYGNYGFVQAKASLTGPLGKKLAARASFSGTQRNGLLYNVRTEKPVNDLNNLGFRGQLLYTPTDNVRITLAGDASAQKPDGYAQVVAGVVTTRRAPYRQFNAIIADLNYSLPSTNPFDRIIDHDSPWRSGNELGGVSLNIDAKLGPGTLTSTTAWRYWNWDPSNDRDFTGLPVLSKSQATSRHTQWTQEIRYAGNFSSRLSGVIGVFAIGQDLNTDPVHIEESGAAQWRFSQSSTSALWRTPGLFDGYGIRTTSRLQSFGGAVFGQVDWAITSKLHLLPGIRFNYDKKEVDYSRQTYGGLQTTDPALIALKNAIYTNQAFQVDVEENNFSGQLTLAYKASSQFNAFATYSNSFKPVGVNLGGLPTASGAVLIDLARVKPEYVTHYEVGVKTRPTPQSTLNLVFHNTDIKDFQTQVQTAEVGVNRGYLANAERVRVVGVELDGNIRVSNQLSFNAAVAYTDGKYVSFTNAPVPLEETGGESAFKDISGGALPGISKWAGSAGGELTSNGKFLSLKGKYFLGLDAYYRSTFSSSASPSQFLNIEGYTLVNGRVGFRASNGVTILVWGRNLLDKDYFEQLLPAAGNAGHYAAVLGDQRTYGVTLRYSF